ncbi:MAG: DUF6660 family protein [Bacteroidia bacterium]
MIKFKQIIATFLAITMMVMFIIPCADACDSNSHQIESSFETPQEHHQEHKDACSPFCSCSCCSIQITVVHFPVLTFVTPEIMKTFSVFKQPFFSSFSSSIWQPPKLG